MNQKAKDYLEQALSELYHYWQRCDDETGEDCKGLQCHDQTHRAFRLIIEALNSDK